MPKLPPRIASRPGDYWVALLQEHARSLREIGVQYFKITDDGIEVTLAPYEAPIAPAPRADDAEQEPADPLMDPATYGRSGNVPGFPRPSDEDDGDYDEADLDQEFGS